MIEQFYNLRPDVLELDRKALELCREPFCHVEEIRDYNQLKMLRAFTDCGVEARHFWGSSGYGVWDDSRNKLEEVFARCMETEKANGQYGKQNPLFMYQGTAGYSIRAELHGSKGGVEAAEAFTAVPSASGQDRCGTMP